DQIDVDVAPPSRRIAVGQEPDRFQHACVVDEDVNCAETPVGFRDYRFDGCVVGNIAGYPERMAAARNDRVGDLCCCRAVARKHGPRGTDLRQRCRGCRTDAAAAARDDRHLAGKLTHASSLTIREVQRASGMTAPPAWVTGRLRRLTTV